MSQRPASNVAQESYAVGARRQSYEVAGHGTESLGTVAMFHSAQNLHIEGSTLSVAGRDVVHNHNHNVHYHYERQRDIWGILRSMPNFRKIYQDMLSKTTPGTGMWLVEGDKFRVWLEPNGDIKIFWGSGIPGAGKTLLASIVIKHLETLYPGPDAKICICYVYFRYSDHSTMTVRTILETLVMQTLERHQKCLALVEQTYAQHLRERTEPTEEQLLALLQELADHMACTFYILDALDEAPTNLQLAVVKALASLNVKLFITSRPLRNVEAKFPHAQKLTIVAQEVDIDLHITKVISESVDLQHLLEHADPSLREEIVSTIKRNCGGMFLHASLQLDALRDCINTHQVRQRLKDFPSRIEDVYGQTWDRILAQNADLVSVAKTVLVWVLNASRSMAVKELERAVATSPDNYKFETDRFVPGSTLMSLCRGVITVEEESGIVRLVHYTAKDMLKKLLDESFPHPHSLLAAVCMSHLAQCGFQDTTISSKEEFEAVLSKDPLLPYASDSWAFHAGKSLDAGDSENRTAQFVSKSKALPLFTSFDSRGARHFDIFTPLHIVGLYCLPLALTRDAIKVNPNVTTTVHQQSPLIVASQSGHEDLVAHLIALSAVEVNQVNKNGRSALLQAAYWGHKGVAKLLLAHAEIQVNLVDKKDRSALMWAAHAGHEGVVKLLLAHAGIQVNLTNDYHRSALMWAAVKGHEGVVKILLAHPEVRVQSIDLSQRHRGLVISQRRDLGAIKLLLGRPELDVNRVGSDKFSALTLAAHKGNEGIVKLLLARPDIQVNLVDKNGAPALVWAARWGREGVLKLLLAHPEIQVNLVGEYGWSALLWAADRDRKGIVKLLLAHPKIQVNLANDFGSTAIELAASRGNEAIVRLLLKVPNIDITIRSRNGYTAKSGVQAHGHHAIVKLLQDFEASEISRLSLHNEDGSDSDSEEAYFDAEEGSEGDGTLGFPNCD